MLRLLMRPLLLLAVCLSVLPLSPRTVQAQTTVSGTISFDKEYVYHLFQPNCALSNTAPYDVAPYMATSALSWQTFGNPTYPRVDLFIYAGDKIANPIQASDTALYSAVRSQGVHSSFNAAVQLRNDCAQPVRTWVMRLYAGTSATSTVGTGTLLAQAAVVVQGSTSGQSENMAAVQYLSAYSQSAGASGIHWCTGIWDDATPGFNPRGKQLARAEFTQIKNGLVASGEESLRARLKRPAITIAINAFDYRKKGASTNGMLDDLDFECINLKIARSMALAEELNIPIDLRVTFTTYTANRPDLWNHWMPAGSVPSPWVTNQAAAYSNRFQGMSGVYSDADYLNYVRANYDLNNAKNVEWTDKGTMDQAVTKAMKTSFLAWYDYPKGLYTAPSLNFASPKVRAEIQTVLTEQVIPGVLWQSKDWHTKGKDYLLAGLTIGLEDNFMAQLCSDKAYPSPQNPWDPNLYCLHPPIQPVDTSKTPTTYGNMAWMQKTCAAAPCATPTGVKNDVLNTVLKEYEEAQHMTIYRTMPSYVREKLYSHVYYHNADHVVLCKGAFNGFAHFGASFYQPLSANDTCGPTESLTYRLGLNDNDGWSIAEAGATITETNYIMNILQPAANDPSPKPNIKLVAFNTWEGMTDPQVPALLRSYLKTAPTATSQKNRLYAGALSSPTETILLPSNGTATIGLSWWAAGPAQWTQAGTELKLRFFIDNDSDDTYDEYYGFTGPNPLPTAQATLSAFQVSLGTYQKRTYVYELVAGTNQSHVIARERVHLVRTP
jgi:hypothetical protein